MRGVATKVVVAMLAVLAALATLVFSCASTRRTSRTTTTSAGVVVAGTPELRTIDNTGEVDPAGRTNEVNQGAVPTTMPGREAIPPPRVEPRLVRPRPAPRLRRHPELMPPSGEGTELIGRISQALCEREAECGLVGQGRTFESAAACMANQRDRVRRAVGELPCEIRGDRISACLTATRVTPCARSEVGLQPPAECTSSALCGP